MNFRGFGYTLIGSREQNQDAYLSDDSLSLYAVADGVGGGYNGEVASQMATQGMLKYSSCTLREAIEKTQTEVLQEAMRTIGEALMGTTLTAVKFQNSELLLAHVGDSRCYLYRDPLLKVLTEDHEVYDENIKGTVLASYLGLAPDVAPLRIQEETVQVVPGDLILLCSDGLYRQVEENRIKELLRGSGTNPQFAVESLCTEASRASSSDNVTAVLIEVS